MRAAFRIAAKDLRLRLRDRSALILGIVAPLAVAFLLRLVIGGADDFSASYAVVDLDGGPVASGFVDVVESLEDQAGFEVQSDLSEDEARQAVTDGDLDAVFVVPDGFSDAAAGAEAAEITVVGNVDAQVGTQIATAVTEAFAADLNAVRLAIATAAPADADPEQIAGLVEAAQATPNPVVVGAIEAATRQLDTTTYLIAGMSVFFLFFLVQFGVTGLLEEEAQGTMARLLAAPVPRWSIPVAKMLTSIALGLIAMTVLIVASTFLMGADWGNPIGVALLVVGGVLAGAGIMAAVAGVAKTPEQAGNVQAIIAVLLGLLGGAFFQVAQGTSLLTRLAAITPHHWFLRGLGDLAGGGGPAAVLPALAALLAFAAVAGGIGMILLNRRVAR
jgi:ABC-2 type transport system permease protein